MEMMVEAGFTTIRIAEFTWGTWNPAPGVFDFTHVDRAIDAATLERLPRHDAGAAAIHK